MRKRRTFKYWIGQLHLWLGLASGLVVLIVGITGCLFVFQKEISESLHGEWFFVRPPAVLTTLPLNALKEKASATLGHPISNITAWSQPDRTWEFMAYKENASALTYFGEIEYFKSVYINPYTGAVTGLRDYKTDFFSVVKYIHWSLLLGTRYGQPIVGWSTLIFVVLLVTGLVLWWPRRWTKATRDRSFKIKWKASFRRVNYDLHNVPGFYTLLPALVIALTGLVFSFRWMAAVFYFVAAGTTAPPEPATPRSDTTLAPTGTTIPQTRGNSPGTTGPGPDPLERCLHEAKIRLPSASRYTLSPPTTRDGVISLYAYNGREVYYDYDVLQFDQYSGGILHHRPDREKNAGEKLIGMNYDIHVGAIGGLTGKSIAFIASLICASLPVTGFLIWRGKRYNKNGKKHNSPRLPVVQ